jgi:methanogenic corrinoid protein MtbC1
MQPALYAIGLGWQENRVTVAQEHLATAICLRFLSDLFSAETPAPPTGRRALFAGVERNQHVLGLRIVADAFELAGWSVQFLGANTPTAALLSQVDRWRPELVGLSASLVQQLLVLPTAIDALHAEFGAQRPAVMVGGIPINQADGIWRRLGADLWSPSAEEAVAEVS